MLLSRLLLLSFCSAFLRSAYQTRNLSAPTISARPQRVVADDAE